MTFSDVATKAPNNAGVAFCFFVGLSTAEAPDDPEMLRISGCADDPVAVVMANA